MPTQSKQWREPGEFAAGDTLSFERALSEFPAPTWSLLYEMRGQTQPISFASTPDGQNHSINVAATVTATWLPGDYTLAGYALNGTTGERQQIYLATITVTPNFAAEAGNEPQLTFEAQMLANLEIVLLAKSTGDLLESSVENSRFRYLSLEEVRKERDYYFMVVANQKAKQNAKMGRPTGNKVRPNINVSGVGPVLGSSVWPFGGSGNG